MVVLFSLHVEPQTLQLNKAWTKEVLHLLQSRCKPGRANHLSRGQSPNTLEDGGSTVFSAENCIKGSQAIWLAESQHLLISFHEKSK